MKRVSVRSTVNNPPLVRIDVGKAVRGALRARVPLACLLLGLVLAACVQGGGPNPTPAPTADLSIGAPQEGQSLAGTIIALAGGVGGTAQDLTFTLGNLEVIADADGTAILDTRSLPDGEYTLEATATVDGRPVSDSVDVEVINDLPDTGTVGPDGGTLKSGEGSYATLPSGALDQNATLTLVDTTQQEILDDFGVDYTDLGVTFLGALTVDATGTSSTRTDHPVQVDLAGWAQAVQPQQDVVMFNVLPDANGDGIGELTFAATARATSDGSVVTLPAARTEVYGLAAGNGSLRLQQGGSVRPGEIVTLQGRGLLPYGALSNTAIFAGGQEILVAATNLEAQRVNPLQGIAMAVPALGSGSAELTLRNASSGFESDPITLQIGSLGNGSKDVWDAFLDQVGTALAGVTDGQEALTTLGQSFLDAIAGNATLHAMAANSGLVSDANLTLLGGIAAGSYSDAQRELVTQHALLLDAMAVSAPTVATSAADLASLLMVAEPASAQGASLRTQQTSGGTCSAGSSAPVFWGQPTGMGSAPPGSCGGGSAGGGGGGGSPLRSQRLGGYGPVEGALVRVFAPDGVRPLSPFTAITDAAGQFFIPFLAPGEPFLFKAFDPATGDTAERAGVAPSPGLLAPVSLAFAPGGGGPFEETELIITEIDDAFEGGGHYALDVVVTLPDPDNVAIDSYLWELDGRTVSEAYTSSLELTLLRAGSYDVRVTVTDDLGGSYVAEETIVVDPFPYPYAAEPPQRVNTASDGSEAVGDPGFALSLSAYPSADGRYIAFASEVANLVPGDTNGVGDVFVKDTQTGATELVSLDDNGPHGSDSPRLASFHLAGSGRHIAYHIRSAYYTDDCMVTTSIACSYVRDRDTGSVTTFGGGSVLLSPDERFLAIGGGSIFVFDIATGDSVLASSAADGTPANADSVPWGFTADSSKLLFQSGADNLVPSDTNQRVDLFLKDLDTGTIERVSVDQSGNEGSERSSWGSISTDGRYVAFATEADELVPGGNSGERVSQIVRKDLQTGEVELVSHNALGFAADNDSYSASISADGRYVAFGGYATDLVPGTGFDMWCGCDSNGYNPGYSYVADMDSGRIALLTYDGDGWLEAEGAFDTAYDSTEPTISADGRWIVVTSEANGLVANDTNGVRDVFLYENPLWEASP